MFEKFVNAVATGVGTAVGWVFGVLIVAGDALLSTDVNEDPEPWL